MPGIKMNTITQDAVVTLTEATAGFYALAYLIDASDELRKDDNIGIATIVRLLADCINNEVTPHIKPLNIKEG